MFFEILWYDLRLDSGAVGSSGCEGPGKVNEKFLRSYSLGLKKAVSRAKNRCYHHHSVLLLALLLGRNGGQVHSAV